MTQLSLFPHEAAVNPWKTAPKLTLVTHAPKRERRVLTDFSLAILMAISCALIVTLWGPILYPALAWTFKEVCSCL